MLGLSEREIEQITKTLKRENVAKAVVFGSRAKGNHRYNSDIDIAIYDDNCNVGHILMELEELPMPYKFDVVAYDRIDNIDLREHIDRVGVEIYARK